MFRHLYWVVEEMRIFLHINMRATGSRTQIVKRKNLSDKTLIFSCGISETDELFWC